MWITLIGRSSDATIMRRLRCQWDDQTSGVERNEAADANDLDKVRHMGDEIEG
jgi:hypothetical protein